MATQFRFRDGSWLDTTLTMTEVLKQLHTVGLRGIDPQGSFVWLTEREGVVGRDGTGFGVNMADVISVSELTDEVRAARFKKVEIIDDRPLPA
jgi:hypothetical protein